MKPHYQRILTTTLYKISFESVQTSFGILPTEIHSFLSEHLAVYGW